MQDSKMKKSNKKIHPTLRQQISSEIRAAEIAAYKECMTGTHITPGELFGWNAHRSGSVPRSNYYSIVETEAGWLAREIINHEK